MIAMLRERKHKQKSIQSPHLSTPSITADYQFVHMPMPAAMNKTRTLHQHTMIPVDRMITTSVESISNDNIKMIDRDKHNKIHQNGLRHYLNINIDDINIGNINMNKKDKKCKKIKGHNKNALNALLSHNAKHQNLHIILILLLFFCVFLMISLCSPDMIGIDDSFQEIYYPQSHTDNFIFVYGPLINKKYKLRENIKYTPKSQRKNPYILHDHFDPDIENDKKLNELNNKKKNNKNKKKNKNEYIIDDEEDDGIIQEFPVRIHHLRRGFYFDTSFNNMDHEEIVKYKTDNDVIMDGHNRINHSYTALGVQFDEEYEVTVNGLLLRIDEKSLLQFDINGFGKAFRRETIPLQWIDFLYGKPKEFTKNMELEQEKLNTIKKETIENNVDDSNYNNNMDRNNGTDSNNLGFVDIKKADIDDANSMIQQHVDIQVEKKKSESLDKMDTNNNNNNNNDNELDIELIDLIDIDQGVILEDDKNINKKDIESIENKQNELNVINEENTKKYQLNVWTYIVPKEIMITDNNGQFERIMKQSYIDMILSGCLDIGGQQFAKEFIQSTFGWTPFMVWNDDRGHSIIFKNEEQYITPYEHEKIDSLLQKYVFGNKQN